MTNKDDTKSSTDALSRTGHEKALELLAACSTKDGFLASPTQLNNYRRIWARDGCIMGLAALLTEDESLINTCRRTLETLAQRQGPHGEIPSNVDPSTHQVSYGGITGRVDADLWFAVCCGQYWRRTGDIEFVKRMIEPLERVRFLLGVWEFNCRGLLYVPLTGDWADEYTQGGYVLYDQLLYLQALREFAEIHRCIRKSLDHHLQDRIARLKHLIRCNYWFNEDDTEQDYVYHKVIYQKGLNNPKCSRQHWMPFFTPAGYGYRFDTLANALVSLLGVSTHEQDEEADDFVDNNMAHKDFMLLPAFYPTITPVDADWEDLQMTFSYTFKNNPHEYHNGGLWPFVNGFYVASCANRGKTDRARAFLEFVHRANATEVDGKPWGFPEFLHGVKHTPGGTPHLGWNAAGAIIGDETLAGKKVISWDTDFG